MKCQSCGDYCGHWNIGNDGKGRCDKCHGLWTEAERKAYADSKRCLGVGLGCLFCSACDTPYCPH